MSDDRYGVKRHKREELAVNEADGSEQPRRSRPLFEYGRQESKLPIANRGKLPATKTLNHVAEMGAYDDGGKGGLLKTAEQKSARLFEHFSFRCKKFVLQDAVRRGFHELELAFVLVPPLGNVGTPTSRQISSKYRAGTQL